MTPDDIYQLDEGAIVAAAGANEWPELSYTRRAICATQNDTAPKVRSPFLEAHMATLYESFLDQLLQC